MVNAKVQAWRQLVAITGRGQTRTGLNFRNVTEAQILARIAVVQAPVPVRARRVVVAAQPQPPNDKVIAWRRLVAITGRGQTNTGLNFRNATEAEILARIAVVQPAVAIPAPIIQAPVVVAVNREIEGEAAALIVAERAERQRRLDRIREEQRVARELRFDVSRREFDERAAQRILDAAQDIEDIEINEATQAFLQEEIDEIQTDLVDDRANITELTQTIRDSNARLNSLRGRVNSLPIGSPNRQEAAINFSLLNQSRAVTRNRINTIQAAMDATQRRLRVIQPLERRLRISEEAALQAAAERFQGQLDVLETQINIQVAEFDRVNDLMQFRVTSNATDVRGLYIAIDKFIEEKGDVPFIILFLIDRLTGRPRRVTINTQYLDTFEDFNDRLAQITFGNVIGSAPITDDQFNLDIQRFDAIFINPLAAGCGTFDRLLCEVVNIKKSGKKTCIKDSMKHFGYDIPAEIKDISKLMAYIAKEKIPVEIVSNKIALTSHKTVLQIYDRKNAKNYNVIQNKKKVVVRMSKLKPQDYFMYYEQRVEHNEVGFVMEKGVRRDIFKTKDVKRIVYSRNERHVAPIVADKDNKIMRRSDMYITGRKELYQLTNGKPVLILSTKQQHQYMRKGTGSALDPRPPIKKSNCQHRYLYIDYETVIDWSIKEVMIPISLSIIDLDENDLNLLVEYEKRHKGFIKDKLMKKEDNLLDNVRYEDENGLNLEGHGTALEKFKISVQKMRSKAVTYVGFDCTMKMMKYIDSQYKRNPQYTLVTFNGSYFDNLILLSDLLASRDHTDKVSDIFYTHNMLRNFKIYGRHEMFDLARHVAGSLAYNCSDKGFKINVFPKKKIDFKVIQEKFESGELAKMMDNYNGINPQKKKVSCEFMDQLVEYNDYDVLSLATLYRLYEIAMDDIIVKALNTDKTEKEMKDNPPDKILTLRNFKTIGSLAYKVLTKYWSDKLDLTIPSFVFKKIPVSANASSKTIKETNEKNWAIHEKNNRYYKYYQDMHKFKTAGRVELFNGIMKYIGRARSLDITSSYPYSMCVNRVYYPTGDMVEIEFYKDLPEGKIGFFYCDIDQKVLRQKGLPNIVAEKTKIENIWQTKKVLKDYFISTIKIAQMVKYGMEIGKDIIIYHGVYFTDKIRGCDLFEPLLSAMLTKVLQDQLKQNGSVDFNAAIRQTVKLFLNCPSGKIIEQIHVNKITEIKNAFHFHEMNESKAISKLNTITIMGDRIFCSYTKREKDMMHTHRPIYWGILVYDYSQINLYDNTLAVGYNSALEANLNETEACERQIMYRKEIFLCDTDACKMSSKAAEMCLGRMSKLTVPHWDKAEKYDARYKDHKMYDPNSKVFGGYEDEFECYNNINYFLAKKHYAGFFDPKQPHDKPVENIFEGKVVNQGEINEYNKLVSAGVLTTLDFHFKGVNKKSLVINTEPYKPDETVFQKITKKVKGLQKISYRVREQRKAYGYFENQMIQDNTMISGKRCCEYFDILSQGKVLHILCASFRKQMSNLKRNTGIEDKDRFNTSFNKVSMLYVVKAIKCVEKHVNQSEERLIEGKDYDIEDCDGELVDKNGFPVNTKPEARERKTEQKADRELEDNEVYETYDRTKLKIIIDNKDTLKDQFDYKVNGDWDIFQMSTNYYNKPWIFLKRPLAQNIVKYKHAHGTDDGRMFADQCLGLQSISKFVRNAITEDIYNDIDMVNAHPNILLFICKRDKIETKYLNDLVNKREEIIKDLLAINKGKKRCDMKVALLSMINNGFTKYNALKKTEWIKDFKAEITRIINRICVIHEDVYKFRSTLALKRSGHVNLKASTVNSLMCKVESNILDACVEFYKYKGLITNNYVMCFDGLMIPKTKELYLRELEQYILLKTKVNIKMLCKPMTEKFDLTGLKIKKEKKNKPIEWDENMQEEIFFDEDGLPC